MSGVAVNGAEPKTKYENDRRYTDEGYYYMPNDETEVKRLDTQHQIWVDTLEGKLFLSPIDLAHKTVLEVGTGSGIWAIQCAEQNPECRILGIDLSQIQPKDVPSNLSFQIADAEKDWTFVDAPFDLIHSRLLVQGMHDWPAYFSRALRHLQPGGWCEAQEIHYPMYCDDPGVIVDNSPFLKWSHLHKAAGARAGIDSGAAKSFTKMMQDAGFVNVKERVVKWPYGPWGKDEQERKIGVVGGLNMHKGLEAFSLALLTRHGGMDGAEAKKVCQNALEDLSNPDRHFYGLSTIHCGQKPA